MGVGDKVYDSDNSVDVYSNYNTTNRHTTIGFEAKTLLTDSNFGNLDGYARLEFGAGSKEKGHNFARTGGEVGLKYTTESDVVDFGIMSDVHFGYGKYKTSRTKTKYDSETGYNYYRPSKTVSEGFYVSPTVGAEIGFNDSTDARISLYGKAGKDLVKGDNFQKVGLAYERPIGGFMSDIADTTFFVQGDYTFNKRNTTFNLNDRKGVNIGAGLRVCF